MIKDVQLRFKRLERETQKAYKFDGHWIPKSVSSTEQLEDNDWRVWVPRWFALKNDALHSHVVDPSSRAAYDHWNEDANWIHYSENPEVFGRY